MSCFKAWTHHQLGMTMTLQCHPAQRGVLGDFWIKQKAWLFLPGAATCTVRFAYKSKLQNSNPLGYGADRYLVGREHLVQARLNLPETHPLALLPFTFSLKSTKSTHVHTVSHHDKRRPEAKKERGKLGHGMTE